MAPRIRWEGSGPPVLVIPGWNTTAAAVGSWLPEAFRSRHQVGVLEWPGLGAAVGEPVPEDLEAFLDDVAAGLPEAPVAAVGFCLGGIAAWALGRRHPDRVRCTALVETPRHLPLILAPLLVPALGRVVLALATRTGWGRALVRRGILQADRAYPATFLATLFAFPVGQALAYLRCFRRFGRDLRGAFEGLPPCILLEGEAPVRAMRPALGRRHDVPLARMRIPGAGHFPAVEAPEACFSALEAALGG